MKEIIDPAEEILRCETPAEWCARLGVEACNPLVAVIDYARIGAYSNPRRLCCGFYVVSLYCGDTTCEVRYGRDIYRYRDGSIFFTAPGQMLSFSDHGKIYQPEENCVTLLFHPDFIRGTYLAERMTSYRFFNYEVNEALRVSEDEMADIRLCLDSIDRELKRAGDAQTADIVASAIVLLLSYCTRFYERQFLPRGRGRNADLLSRFESLLNDYFSSPADDAKRCLPTVRYFADKLSLTPDYLSSLLQKATGRNARQHIQYRLIETAKDLLHHTDKTVSEIAYELGFEYPHYFSRLFRKKTGLTPAAYRSHSGKL